MRKALCFVVLAFFLAVSLASSIHAVVYPSDAPLPRFEVSKVSGCPFTVYNAPDVVGLRFECKILNAGEIIKWFEDRTPSMIPPYVIRLFYVGGEWSFFASDGDIIAPLTDTAAHKVVIETNQWNKIVFEQIMVEGGYGSQVPWYQFMPLLYFCDVYVPLPSDLPIGVWTDLQFKQTDSSLAVYLPLVVGMAVAVFCVFYVGAKKRG